MVILLSIVASALAVMASPVNMSTSVVPDPSQVYIKDIAYGGTGCPQGSMSTFISDDKQTFTLIFDSYVASVGPGVSATESRKNCQLNIDLHYPSGFQYSIFNTEYRGYAALDAGVTGLQKSTYYFSGQSQQVSTSTTFNGPFSSDYLLTDNIPFTSVIWSPCGTSLPLNVNSQVRLTSNKSTASGLLTDDSIDGHVTFVCGIKWQEC